ncbi:MAG: TerB family tellurite resistance protein [Micavibrio sp.]|nr:TerB family tellurite resistance protein [Micavibrio sp.]
MSSRISQSEFYMWRTLFAIAHADHVVTDEEVRFMSEALEDVDFSPEQYAVLKDDIVNEQDIEEMFKGITDVKDQAALFKYARQLCHIDGDFGEEEQEVIMRLQKLHLKYGKFDEIVGGRLDMELELELEPSAHKTSNLPPEKRTKSVLSSFKRWFTDEK